MVKCIRALSAFFGYCWWELDLNLFRQLTLIKFQLTAISSTHPWWKVSIDINYVISPHVETVVLLSRDNALKTW